MQHDSQGYWKATLGLLGKILAIWFICSFGAGYSVGSVVVRKL